MLSKSNVCWCGSNLIYGKCHFEFDEKLRDLKRRGHIVPTRKLIKTRQQIEGIKKSAKINNSLLDLISSSIKEGMTTQEINDLAYDYTTAMGGIPAPLNYNGFPKSICTSVNNEVCHGIPSKKVILKSGDIINVDATTMLNGYYSDASRMFMIGKVSPKAKEIVEVAKECLYRGVKAVRPWGYLGDIGAAIKEYAEAKGCSVVREFGGHGVGLDIHEPPFVSHIGIRGKDMVLAPGMVFTIEPMINAGGHEIYIDENNSWTALTADGSLSAQWEYTILVTEEGVEIISG